MRATEEMRHYLEKLDWSGLTPGRRRILEAFIELASEEGYSSVSMRSLAKKVSMKAPSIYSHFPGGRDEVVADAFRWHFSRFATAVLEAVDGTDNAGDFWDAMVRVHLKRQLQSRENDAWDILRALDRLSPFLERETRTEVDQWVGLYERMFAAAARELGHDYDDVEKIIRVVVKILDSANGWCDWNGDEESLDACVGEAVTITRSLLSVDLRSH
ncbi:MULTISPECIES: TetR/AcrR family transcriptional regulator [Streptomyces]|uniref:TetR/AcrR family transcriptional regulator n=1 Tax=Streptomyces TaxID=1883 RepID=UPI0021CFD69F|nr:TetR/AcrR family transcriptional regulator [Streptomyces sp. NEAU-383]